MLLINGKCEEHLNELYTDNSVIVTDPPFNIGYHYKTYRDRMKHDDYIAWLVGLFVGKRLVIVHYPETLHELSARLGTPPVRVVSWVYNSNTARQHRDIAFYGVEPNFKAVRQPYKNPNDKRIKELIKKGLGGGRLYDWLNINQVKNISKEKTEHPCQMPVELMEKIIGLLPADCVVIDPFMGSGTTGKAVYNMNQKQNVHRDFIGIELDTEYYGIAQRRIENRRKS